MPPLRAAFPFGCVVSFLRTALAGVEDDYAWGYNSDPRISPLTTARWRFEDADPRPDRRWLGRRRRWRRRRALPARHLDGRMDEYIVVDTSATQLARQWFPAGARGLAIRAARERFPLPDDSADTLEMWGVLDHSSIVPRRLPKALASCGRTGNSSSAWAATEVGTAGLQACSRPVTATPTCARSTSPQSRTCWARRWSSRPSRRWRTSGRRSASNASRGG